MNPFTTKNLGTPDRLVRSILGLFLTVIGFTSQNPVLVLLGLFTLYEALSSWCILYAFLGKNTCPVKHSSNPLQLIFLTGLFTLTVAIILNLLAQALGLATWYSFLNQVQSTDLVSSLQSLSLLSSLFLFFLYPLFLGAIPYYLFKILSSQKL